MAGATSKTSVKSTATKKAARTTTVKSSKVTKTTTKSVAAKPAAEKKTTVKKSTKSASVVVKPKSAVAQPAVKTASKPKTASDVKSKSAPASKSKAAPAVKTAKKSEASKKADAKKTVKAEKITKPAKADAAKKTSKATKAVQAEAPVKTTKKTAPVKTTSTKTPDVNKTKTTETVSKQSADVKASVKKAETPVVEQEQVSKPKAKRATKFMTKANAAIIAQLRQQLLQRRNEILSFYWGDLGSANVSSQASGDTADAATDSVHSEMNSQLAEKESQELTDINNALHKMETGEYGLCEECGMPIAIERLEAIPDAELCLKCQEELEEDGDYDNYSYYRYE